jgi:DNA-binding transcriptional regulator YhcF (GntR family)
MIGDFKYFRIGLELKRAILKKPSKAVIPEVRLEQGSSVPLQRQLHQALRQIIVRGRLDRGVLLPSTRRLATALGVSRNTVLFAYEELAAQGVVYGRTGSGTRVDRTNSALCFIDPDGHVLHCLQGTSN